MKIIFFEELLDRRKEIINDILTFVGSLKQYDKETLAVANKGDFVMADLEGFRLAKLQSNLWRKMELIGRNDQETKHQLEVQYIEVTDKYKNAKKYMG